MLANQIQLFKNNCKKIVVYHGELFTEKKISLPSENSRILNTIKTISLLIV